MGMERESLYRENVPVKLWSICQSLQAFVDLFVIGLFFTVVFLKCFTLLQ